MWKKMDGRKVLEMYQSNNNNKKDITKSRGYLNIQENSHCFLLKDTVCPPQEQQKRQLFSLLFAVENRFQYFIESKQ